MLVHFQLRNVPNGRLKDVTVPFSYLLFKLLLSSYLSLIPFISISVMKDDIFPVAISAFFSSLLMISSLFGNSALYHSREMSTFGWSWLTVGLDLLGLFFRTSLNSCHGFFCHHAVLPISAVLSSNQWDWSHFMYNKLLQQLDRYCFKSLF